MPNGGGLRHKVNPIWTSLSAAGTACALASFLVIFAKMAGEKAAARGTFTVDINKGTRRLAAAAGERLMRALRNEGIFMPSACGGRGACGYCKCRVTSGGGALAPAEERLLTEAEKARGVRLSCQVPLRGDMTILIPEGLFAVKTFRGVVERIGDLTYDIKELHIRLIQPRAIEFIPGQYVQLEAPPPRPGPPVRRAYSMSSPPADNGRIELMIRLVPGGMCTTWVFNVLRQGDEVTFSGPYGEFHMSNSSAEMIWIGGGSGMAPFWSLVRHMKASNIARACTYFFGAVRKRDLFLVDELRQLEKELPWFTFIPALSGRAEGEEWSGERGLITEVLDRHVAGGAGKEAYLCGSPGMIDAAIKVLSRKGVTGDRIFYDKFT